MDAQADLDSQQKHLTTIDYDLRITNLARFIHKKIKSVHGDKKISLIDIGAGNGLFLKFFKDAGITVTGIEYEKHLVEKMKKDPVLRNISISQGDITKIKGKAGYDVVIASDVIEHIEDYEKAIENLWTFVAPGGLLIITVPAHSFLYGKRDEAWGHYRRYDKHVLQNAVSKTGGEIQFITFWNFVGFFAYFFYEKVLHKQINEEMRYGTSLKSRIVRSVLDGILKLEEKIGGLPLGLTLIVGVRKA